MNTRDAPHTYFGVGLAYSKMVFSTTAVGSPSFSQSSSSAAVAGLPSQGSTVTSSVMFDFGSSVIGLWVVCYLFFLRFRN